MNFFEQQDLAQRNTKRLIALLFAAVLSLILITTLLFAFIIFYLQSGSTNHLPESQPSGLWQGMFNALSWELLGWMTFIICGVVFLGSLYKLIQLRSGGRAVAEAMGGRLINTNASDMDEKKILNVVEEMAIASGTPVPPVYIIEDDAINAFAAGHNAQDAVIGITRGCIRLLKRDELQGVVAHEFSHIFHGDMRLNIRLVALLNGILLIGLIGQYMVRSTSHRSMFRSSRDKSPAAILGIGIALMVIGYGGTFFGNIIKAAVSRQREFLADASAVQFTRNPGGISGALKKIGGYVSGSRLESVHAAEFSHMYFSQGVSTAFNAMMATHPPLDQRIKRIEPRWDGKYPQVEITLNNARPAGDDVMQTSASQFAGQQPQPSFDINTSLNHIGQPTPSHLEYAQQTLASISDELREAAHDPFSARGLIYGLLLDRNEVIREKQWELLSKETGKKESDALKKIAHQSMQLHERARLPLVELSLPTLKQLSPEQQSSFIRCLDVLIHADKKVNLMEWAINRIIIHHLKAPAVITRHHELRELRNECQLLLSVLAYAGAKNEAAATESFRIAVDNLRLASLTLLPKSAVKIASLDDALDKLNRVKALQKPQLLKAMSQCILHDGDITVAEAELFRAFADGLDCPIPPLLRS
jgi:Zn-dependent protease with chaperone function